MNEMSLPITPRNEVAPMPLFKSGRLYVKFSPMAPSIGDQVESCGMRIDAMADIYQRAAVAISRLRLHGILTEKESFTAFKRLFKKIERAVKFPETNKD